MSDPFDPRRRTPDPSVPRASDGYRAGRAAEPGTPGGPSTLPPGVDPVEALLTSYARATDVPPSPDLSRRIHARLSREPARTPPRRFLVALLGLRLTQAGDAFRQMAGVAVGRGRFPAAIRGQALALVALTIGMVGVAGFAGAVGVTEAIRRIQEQPPVIRLDGPSPSPATSPTPSPREVPTPSPAMGTLVAETDDPTPSAGPTSPRTPQSTERPGRTHDAGRGGDATQRPARTPRPTQKSTPKATQRPTHTPRATPRPTRRPTPEPTDDDHHGGHDDGPETPDPNEEEHGGHSGPDDASGTAGAVVAMGVVLLVLPA